MPLQRGGFSRPGASRRGLAVARSTSCVQRHRSKHREAARRRAASREASDCKWLRRRLLTLCRRNASATNPAVVRAARARKFSGREDDATDSPRRHKTAVETRPAAAALLREEMWKTRKRKRAENRFLLLWPLSPACRTPLPRSQAGNVAALPRAQNGKSARVWARYLRRKNPFSDLFSLGPSTHARLFT